MHENALTHLHILFKALMHLHVTSCLTKQYSLKVGWERPLTSLLSSSCCPQRRTGH